MKKYLHWAGSLLAAVGIIFIALRLRDYSGQINFSNFGWEVWWVVGCCAVVYGLANNLMALAWWHLLRQFGTIPSLLWAIRIYGISQLAKYVPGNVFQFAGRQAFGMAAGIPGWTLAKSTIWELGLLAVSGSLFSLLVLPHIFASLPVGIGIGAFILAVVVVATVLKAFVGSSAVKAFGLYVVFLIISGTLFVSLVSTLYPPALASGENWIVLCGAYVVAWLIGLITPGAPAGVGVRELILVMLLPGLVGESELLLTVVLGRVVTVVGDVLFFIMASLLNQKVATEV